MKKNIQGFFCVVKEVLYVLNKKQKKQSVILLVLVFFCSLFELLGVSIIVPFVQSISMPEQLLKNQYIGKIWSLLRLDSYNELIALMGVALIVVFITKNAFIIFASYKRVSYTTQWQKDISLRMFRSYLSRPYTFFLGANSAEILRGCTSDAGSLNNTLNQFFVFVTESLTVAMIGVYLIYTDWFTAIGALLLTGAVFCGIMLVLKPRVKEAGRMQIRALTSINKSITQSVQGIKDILVMQRRAYFIRDYEQSAEYVRASTKKYNVISMLPDRITEGLCVSGVIGVVLIRLLFGGQTTDFVPKLAAFAMGAFKVFPSVGKISNSLNSIMFNRPGQHNVYTNICEIEGEEKKTNADKQSALVTVRDDKGITEYEQLPFEVVLDHVAWRYHDGQELVLKGLSIRLKKGESIGLIGSSGGGKTTTVDILLGLFKPEKGTVIINGRSIYDMPYTWAQLVSYVPQNVFLMDDTVRANVQFGLTDVSDEEVWDALERAQLRSFIESLPKQLDTEVGERGVRFSGGQRQRIAIARALLNKPQILVLDEATAALDNETENAVMGAIEVLQGSVTLVIVAHRLTTIRNCDRVYEIKDGIATEVTGRFKENG